MIDYLKPVRGQTENAAMTFVGYALIFLAWTIGAAIFLILGTIAFGEDQPWETFAVSLGQFIPILAAVIGATYLFKRKPITVITSRGHFSFKIFCIGALSWGGLLVLGSLMSWALDPSSLKFTFNLTTFIPALIVLILLLPIQVSAEEVFFRGFIPQSLSRTKLSDGLIVLISSLLFAVPHLLNPEAQAEPLWSLLAYTAMGFGWLQAAKWFGGLEIAIGAHLVNNFFGLAIVGYENSVVAPSSIWIGPPAQMQSTAIALWVIVGIWLLILKKIKTAKPD